jgi:MoaA/NifB/PqqE/SkfB family radical SAM enzyme
MTNSTANSKTFCPLPFIHLATRPNGDVRLCCTSNASGAGKTDQKEIGLITNSEGTKLNLRNHTIEEVWNSDFMKQTRLKMLSNIIPDSCTKCFEEESRGIKSKRNWESQVWSERLDLNEVIQSVKSDGSMSVDIPYFDLRLGNMCNLKCIMCSPHDSSSWIKDWKIQTPQYKNKILIQDQNWDRSMDYTWYKKSSFIESMKSQASHIKELYFAGGEPLLIPEHYNILKFMVDTDNAKNCVLRYNSNGTEISDELLELWKRFKLVKFNFSIDAFKEKNDYIRFPSKWENIVNNLHKLDNTPENVIINIACAVQLLNIKYIDELIDWKISQNFKKINTKEYGAGLVGLHLVYLPSYLNIRVLPKKEKQIVTERIHNLINKYSSSEFDHDPYGKQRYLGLLNYMNSEDWSHKIPALQQYLSVTDKTRNTNYQDIFDLKLYE